jgi:pectate lyase
MEDITWNIDYNDKFKVSIKLGSGKEIKIEDSTNIGIKDLTISELQEANKKLSETISLLNQMLK